MKAIYIREPGKVEICETAMPVRKAGEALLQVLYGGICGSDLGAYRGPLRILTIPAFPGMNSVLRLWKLMITIMD